MFKKAKKIKNIKAIALLAVAFILSVFVFIFYIIYIPVNIGNSQVKIVINKGDSLRSIAKTLRLNNVIRSELAFRAFVRLSGDSNRLKAGRYNFSGRLDMDDTVFILVSGLSESDDIRLLISEGFNIWEVDKRLISLGFIKEGDFASRYHQDEGYLFPDTYRINREAEGQDFPEKFRQRMRDDFNAKTTDGLGGLSLAESREIMIIASILEKEARLEKDMKLVSGIIRNRLAKGMPLQVDATVIYGACIRKSQANNFKKNCDVTLQGPALEIKIDGPFNTYTRKGLPPSPISNPGLNAIDAALHPTKTDYFYYLSTRDGSRMIYSRTPSEHAANRRTYLGL